MTLRRLALVSSSFWPHEGGAERQLRRVLEAAPFEGTQILVLAEQLRAPRFETHVERLRIARPSRSSRLGVVRKSMYVRESIARLREFEPDAVISSQVGLATLIAGAFSAMSRVPHVVRLASGGASPAASGGIALSPLGEGSARWWLNRRIVLNERCTLVAPAQHLCRLVRDKHGDSDIRVHYIPNGVDDGLHSEPSQAKQWDVVWYGRDDWLKNPGALAQLAKMLPQIGIVTIGETKVATGSNVLNLGWVERPQDVMRKAKVAVLTSRYEGSPNFALDAVAMGVPVVAFETDAMTELAAAYPRCIRLVPQGDVHKLSAAVASTVAHFEGVHLGEKVPTISQVSEQWFRFLDGLTLGGRWS